MSVSVAYTYNPNTATVTVLLEKNGGNPIEVTPALLTLAKGEWTVTWNLQAGTGVTNPSFNEEDGIAFGDMPPSVNPSDSQRVSSTQWQATISNEVEVLGEMEYDIHGTSDQGSFQDLDPTVAVTPDPPPA